MIDKIDPTDPALNIRAVGKKLNEIIDSLDKSNAGNVSKVGLFEYLLRPNSHNTLFKMSKKPNTSG